MAEDPRIAAYKEAILKAQSIFDAEVQKNGCPTIDLKRSFVKSRIGRGGFSNVYRVEFYNEDRTAMETGFAIKQQCKKQFRDLGYQLQPIQEKKFLWALSNPWVVDLLFKAKDKENLYLIMEYTPYRDLRKLSTPGPLSEDNGRKLLSQVVMGLEYVHACNLVFRDLKATNVLVFPRGRLKLADFGLAVRQTDSLNNWGGTPEYSPPEIILKKLYNCAADWWSFGIMMFKLLINRHPFSNDPVPPEDLHRRILYGSLTASGLSDSGLSAEAKDLIEKLLAKDQNSRIGRLAEGVMAIKNHAWFKSIDFDRMILGEETFYDLDPKDHWTARETISKTPDMFSSAAPDEEDPQGADFSEF